MIVEKTRTIGFFLDDRIKDGISNPYYSLVFNALEKEAVKSNYNLIFYSKFDDLYPSSHKMKIDGLIICFFLRMEKNLQKLNIPVPVVLIDNQSADKSIPSVTIDNYNSVMDAMKYLCSLGHKRIGFITGMLDSHVGKDRLNGYKKALDDHGIDFEDTLVYRGNYSYLSGEKGAGHFLSQHKIPSAIMCSNDSMAIGAIKTISQAGLSVPGDISVIGFDDIAVASQIYPPLTTMAAPITEIARISVSILMALINGVEPDGRHISLPAHLIERNSCAVNRESVFR
jgi:DNA-binding LacI/PurR family transcriptional regulator